MNRVIVAQWASGKVEVYSSLTAFIRHNGKYSRHTINNYLTRKGMPFKSGGITITRCEVKRR